MLQLQTVAKPKKYIALLILLLAAGVIGVRPAMGQTGVPPVVQRTSNFIYSAFLGGSGNDCFPKCVITVDAGGSTYIAGHTVSADFSGLPDAQTETIQSGNLFVAKINIDGTGFDYVTTLGGSAADYATGIAVDGAGNAYVTGYTASDDFPVTTDALQPEYGGGYSDAFVLKINPTGSAVVYASYLGGSDTDRGAGLAIDSRGAIYLTGETQSADFPVTDNAFAPALAGDVDTFVAKLPADGAAIEYATYLGGSSAEESQGIAVDLIGQIYVTGRTVSADFPVTENAVQPDYHGAGDAYVAKLNPARNALAFATYLGGGSNDRATAIAIDNDQNIYLTGSTISADFPVTDAAFSTNHHGAYDAFAVKLASAGDALDYATFLGGQDGDRGYAIAVDSAGVAYVTGATYSPNFPITPTAFDTSYNFGYADAFMAKVSVAGDTLTYATFLGGSQPDYGSSIAVDGEGSAYLAGATLSPSFPATVRGFDSAHNGEWDGFVTKLSFDSQKSASLISGIVRDQQGNAVAGAVVSAGTNGSTTTDSNGVYVLIGLDPGRYTLTPMKPGYTFSPARRTVNVPSEQSLLVFTGVEQGNPPEPFLDLPLDYGDSVSEFVRILQDTDSRGWITSWFDHAYPDYGKNQRMALGDGIFRTESGYNWGLGCYERRCYDGHDGIDFIYRDFKPGVSKAPVVNIRAAADGVVSVLKNDCVVGDKWCGGGLGNSVVINHQNGYFTLYGHLSTVSAGWGQTIEQGQTIGTMGNTGNSTGFHLHFGVYRDDGNGKWDRGDVDLPVDPFGWRGNQADPWVVDRQGPISTYLWQYPLFQQEAFVGSQGVTLADTADTVEVTVPAGALSGQSNIEMVMGSAPGPIAGNRSAGQSFELRLLEWLPGLSTPQIDDGGMVDPSAALAQSVTLNARYDTELVRHLDVSQLQIHQWNADEKDWLPLSSNINQSLQLVTAQSNSLGQFNLQAPLLCPADSIEPDDNYYAARELEIGAEPAERLLDIETDEDWFYFETMGRAKHIIQTTAKSGVLTQIDVFDLADGSLLVSAKSDANGTARLEWFPPAHGTYFVRVAGLSKSRYGCNATYSLQITYEPYKLYLPLITK